MEFQILRRTPLPLVKVTLLALCACPLLDASATTNVTLGTGETSGTVKKADSPAWHRKLWEGSFDRAGDASGSVANQLDGGLEFNCEQYQQNVAATADKPARQADMAAYTDCTQRESASRNYAGQARSIQKQQRVFSVISKVSDVAAVGAVGAVAYSELGVKTANQSDTYEKAARIQKKAGQASYITGATDLTLGAYAFVAHKNKLEKMQRTLTNNASTDNAALNSSLANAVEASKKAAYNHMMYGAGKMAVGYASMHLAKRSQDQADKMVSIEEDAAYKQWLLQQQAAAGTVPQATAYAVVGSGTAPYYTNNNPVFTMPNGVAATSNTGSGVVSYTIPGGGSGASVAPQGGVIRNLATAGNKGGGLSGSSGGGGNAPDAGGQQAEVDPEKEKNTKEAINGNFETSLTGGMKFYAGIPSEGGDKDEVPNLAGLMGTSDPAMTAATGLSPTQLFNEATEGTEGTEEGSMAGVNGKRETSLFEIMRQKTTKMFQVGNVGIPKNVEVKN